jgi:hypothetical protein
MVILRPARLRGPDAAGDRARDEHRRGRLDSVI